MTSRGFLYALGTGARKSFVLLWTAVLLCSLLLQYVAIAAPAPVLAVHNEGLFELDGNVEDPAGGGDDWNTIFGGGGTAGETVFLDDQVNGNNDKYFTGGSTKDVTDINQWAWTTVSQPQDKNDIANAYAAAYKKDGDVFAYFGLDRYASNGAAQVGFWFLQDDFGLTNAGGSVGTRQSATSERTFGSTSLSPVNSAVRMCSSRSILANATCRIVTEADRKFRAAIIRPNIASGIGSPV